MMRSRIDRLSAAAGFLAGCLAKLAVGPELRVSRAIAEVARQARVRRGQW